jgi:hypothetical protein
MCARREEAAFHEAGHCYVAVRVVGRVVGSPGSAANAFALSKLEEGWPH